MQHVLYDAFKLAVRDCGENSKLTLRCLRHTTVTRLLQSGAQGADVAKITGHIVPGTVKMQLRYYHPDREHLFKVAKILHARLGETPQSGTVACGTARDRMRKQRSINELAEGVGFEPTSDFRRCRFSRPVP
jgi:AraC-like DNA-binding protein